ncbi:TPA: hypothetical protein DCF80_00770 [Candidatus Saccharibacteria bacterium]|nr:hypothetical protein [Candidatus Saccharibacteria bacterium]
MGGILAAKQKLQGDALRIMRSISATKAAELNCRAYQKLCTMLRSNDVVWKVLADYDKDGIIRSALQQTESSASSARKEAS